MSKTPIPLPWRLSDLHGLRIVGRGMDGESYVVADLDEPAVILTESSRREIGRYIVRAVNAHEALVAACRAMLAWGDQECFPMGGPWAQLEAALALALALAEGKVDRHGLRQAAD
jgi:hypothetical protein